MNLKDFQRVIDTCTKMKEIIIFSELFTERKRNANHFFAECLG